MVKSRLKRQWVKETSCEKEEMIVKNGEETREKRIGRNGNGQREMVKRKDKKYRE